LNSIGNLFKVTLYGESHQDAIGVVIDGVIPGIKIYHEHIEKDLKLRRPGAIGTTKRVEEDLFSITSGVFNGFSTGSPIHLTMQNLNIQSKDYDHLIKQPRPGHADFVSMKKYLGFHDHRGGGRFSGRLTAPIVAAGAIAKMMLPMTFSHELIQIGSCKKREDFDTYLQSIEAKGDSVGGIIKITVSNMPIGLGEPMFEKLDANIVHILMSMPAVKLVTFGDTLDLIEATGSMFNDAIIDASGKTSTNHSGGVTGGISNGNDLGIYVFVKPTSSISSAQETFNFQSNEVTSMEIGGRHDICIARRAGIVMENATAIALADLYLMQKMYGNK
jgi:chorismate synthase